MALEYSADYYRRRAAEMKKMAEAAQTESIRAAYLAIAHNWETLAVEAEGAMMPPPAGGGDEQIQQA